MLRNKPEIAFWHGAISAAEKGNFDQTRLTWAPLEVCLQLDFRPVTEENWRDFERLMESRGSPHYCWCTAWRSNENKKTIPGNVGKKISMETRVVTGTPIGILAYHEGQPMAWCSIAPRESYRRLGGDEALENVWSLVCFFVQRPFRNQGVSAQLLQAGVNYARDNGAKHVEAYPVAPESTTYRFMGLVPAFQHAGFRFVKTVGSRRNLMTICLENHK